MKKLLLSALVALATLPMAAKSDSHSANQQLWRAIESVGVTPLVNHPTYCNDETDGQYRTAERIMVVCQDLAKAYDGNQVDWTPNDIDTLKHEAHHIVQDCVSSRLGDGVLNPVFEGDEFYEFVRNAFTPEELTKIQNIYRAQGASNAVIVMEMEAFATAKMVDSSTIAKVLIEICGAN